VPATQAWATELERGIAPGGAPASAARPDRTHAPGSGHDRGAATPGRSPPTRSFRHGWRRGSRRSRSRPPATTAPATPAAAQSPWWSPRPRCLWWSCLDHRDPTASAHRPLVCNRSTPPEVPHWTRVRPRRDPVPSPGDYALVKRVDAGRHAGRTGQARRLPAPRAWSRRPAGPGHRAAAMRHQAARRGCRWSRTRDLEGRPGSRRWPTSTGRPSDEGRGCTPTDAPRAEPALEQAGRQEEEPNPSPPAFQMGAPTRQAIAPDRGAATRSPQVHDADEALRTECPVKRRPVGLDPDEVHDHHPGRGPPISGQLGQSDFASGSPDRGGRCG
jgi:hypothetical protein